jgi:type VI secretion system secreted protein VgrG
MRARSGGAEATKIMRQTSLTIDLGGEQVKVRRVEASETLGRPFSFVVDLVAPLGPVDILPHLGKPASVTVYQDDKLMRHYHGIVVEGAYVSERDDGHSYRIWLRPWTYLAAQNRDYAIFQEKTAVDIAKEVYGALGFAKVDYSKLSKSRAKREYCVQYGESDFAFITRLMEEEGIYYYFEHTADEHTMVLCEAPASHVDGKPPLFTYNPMANSVANVDSAIRASIAKKDYIYSWTERVSSGAEAKVTLRDFDFTKTDKVESVVTGKQIHPQDEIEVYRFPAKFLVEAEGKTLGEARLNALRANRQTFSGETQVESVACGKVLKLKDHPNGRYNGRYLITSVQHVTSAEMERSGSGEGGHVFVEAIPADTLFHVQPTVQRPSTRGLETAIVTGPQGEEIYTDKYGRVKVRFHWDRAGTPGEKSTCWIRVSQTGGLGNIVLPRVGHEVIVDFLDGDPDRPIVTGRVFNSKNMPVYPLPDNKTRAVWRTKTYGAQSSYGAAEGLDTGQPKANELRFEDKGGKEEVFLHAERDYNVRVRHIESRHIGLDQSIKIGGSRDVKIKETDTLDVKKSISIKAGTTIMIEAGSKITLKVGQSTIEIDPTSIKMKTTIFQTEGTASADVKAPMTTVKGDAMLTLKGGMTLINT